MSSTLAVGDWIVARSEGGLLDVEYALFESSEVLLAASIGVGAREQGYLTTAGIARARLNALGVTSDLALASFDALQGSLAELARSPDIARVCERLGPSEAFQGGVFDAEARRYDGTWLDLDAVARACPLPDAALAMQLVHLASIVAEIERDAPIRLLTGKENARVGERTWHRVATDSVRELPRALAHLRKPVVVRVPASVQESRDALLLDLRSRAALTHDARPRLQSLAFALSRTEARRATPSAEPAAREMPRAQVGVPDVIITDDVEFDQAPVPLLDELREHSEMLHGEWHLREVAQFLTAMMSADRTAPASDLAILASRAWLASGETGYARYFARRVTEDPTAVLGTRIAAIEILESTTATGASMQPPAPTIATAPVVIVNAPHSHAPPGASLPSMTAVAAPAPSGEASLPARVEVIETMSAPEGDETRMRMTKLAREVARDYRLAYGTTLKTDAAAVDAMQRHLRRRFGDAKQDERRMRMLETELTRHGALLSEILARALGAHWVDVSSPEIGRWAMLVPPSTRVFPIGRIYRFFQQGPLEGDLVAFYDELEKTTRV